LNQLAEKSNSNMSVSGSVSPLSGTSQSVLPASTIMRCIAWCVTAPARPGLRLTRGRLAHRGALLDSTTERLDACDSREWHACGTASAEGCHRGRVHKLEREHGGLPEYTMRSQRKDVRSSATGPPACGRRSCRAECSRGRSGVLDRCPGAWHALPAHLQRSLRLHRGQQSAAVQARDACQHLAAPQLLTQDRWVDTEKQSKHHLPFQRA